jgi:hypothetical protein
VLAGHGLAVAALGQPAERGSDQAEPAFIVAHGAELAALGHTFTETPQMGAATGIELLPGGPTAGCGGA